MREIQKPHENWFSVARSDVERLYLSLTQFVACVLFSQLNDDDYHASRMKMEFRKLNRDGGHRKEKGQKQ